MRARLPYNDGQVANECRKQPSGGTIGKRGSPDARARTPGKRGIPATSLGDCPEAVTLRSHHRKPAERRHSSHKLASDRGVSTVDKPNGRPNLARFFGCEL